jgi:hypothetical protein
MQSHLARFVRTEWKRAFSSMAAVLLLCSALHAQEACTVEVKLLLAPPTIKSVIDALRFERKTTGRVYFFDTNDLGLLAQGAIVRLRQGAKNDLTVKVRLPEGNKQIDSSKLREHFGCEIDRTGTGASTSFSVGQKYKHRSVPEAGDDIFAALSAEQRRLLQEAQVSIDWSRVRRIANINSTTWQTSSQSPSPKLTLEYWKWTTGNILELSARGASNEMESKFADLQQMVNKKGLLLSANQGTKTSIVLKTMTQRGDARGHR